MIFRIIDGESIVDLIPGSILVLVVCLGYPIIIRLTSIGSMKKFSIGKDVNFFNIKIDGVDKKTAFSSVFTDWDDFYSLIEIKEHFVFYRNDGIVYLIPKMSLSEDEIHFVRNCAADMPLPTKPENLFKIAIYIILFIFGIILLTAIFNQFK